MDQIPRKPPPGARPPPQKSPDALAQLAKALEQLMMSPDFLMMSDSDKDAAIVELSRSFPRKSPPRNPLS
jgi:hypothetical protein